MRLRLLLAVWLLGACGSNTEPPECPLDASPSRIDAGIDAAPVDSGPPMPCAAGTSQLCYGAPLATVGIGICRAGVQACDAAAGTFGACQGAIVPGEEVCANGLDDDCDGASDEDCASVITAQTLAIGRFGGCVRDASTGWRCWGQGPVGDGTSEVRPGPVAIAGLEGAVVSVGGSHMCAVMPDRTARCWGSNGRGQLGDGTRDSALAPQAVPGLTDVVEIGAGDEHTCARRENGEVWCWGNAQYNRLGYAGDMYCTTYTDTASCSLTPRLAGEIAGVVQLSVGMMHACALLPGGEVRCWGDNDSGRVTWNLFENGPIDVASIHDASFALAGGMQSCAIVEDGRVRCWGENLMGALGDGENTLQRAPLEVLGLTDIVQVAAGLWHTCALRRTGTVNCWGDDSRGQLGDALEAVRREPGDDVPGLSDVVEIDAGEFTTCARRRDETVWCWGHNEYGQLGDGTMIDRPTPVQIL